jgi:hypothetical protein
MPAPVSAAALQGRLNQFLEGIPCNYDTYISLELDWPSLSLQWTRQQQLHEGPADSDGQQSSFSLLLGTQTDGQEDNQVLLLPTHLPQDHYQHAPEDLEQQLLLGPAKVGSAAGWSSLHALCSCLSAGRAQCALQPQNWNTRPLLCVALGYCVDTPVCCWHMLYQPAHPPYARPCSSMSIMCPSAGRG